MTEAAITGEQEVGLGKIDARLLPIGYSGDERLVYDVSWSGGIKIGELHLEVRRLPDEADGFEIEALVTTRNGALDLFYPIEDRYLTRVRGVDRLPYSYEVWQKEGYRYRAHRLFEFDQAKGSIRYWKNDRLEAEYQVAGPTNNEFSSFFNSRLMLSDRQQSFVVPTFADKKRVEVVVHVVSKTRLAETLFGPIVAVGIMPVMTFKGLYEKRGDTVIWYTDDECRVPVRVQSKVRIGSLTADLAAYGNSACTRYTAMNNN